MNFNQAYRELGFRIARVTLVLANLNRHFDDGQNRFEVGLIPLDDAVVKVFNLGSRDRDDERITDLLTGRRMP